MNENKHNRIVPDWQSGKLFFSRSLVDLEGRRRKQKSGLFLGSIPRPGWLVEYSPPPPSGLRQRIDEILSIDFSKYVSFMDPRGFERLKAMFIMTTIKGGSAREFWITGAAPRLMGWSLASFLPRWQEGFASLADRANHFMQEMRSNAPYWQQIPDVPRGPVIQVPDPPAAVAERVRELTAGASMHLMYAIQRGGGNLPQLTEYPIRCWGIHEPDTSNEILASGLLQVTSDPLTVVRKWVEKSRLLDACASAGIACTPRWTKNALLQALTDSAPAQICKLAAEVQTEFPMIVETPPHLADDLKALLTYASGLEIYFYALGFAGKIPR